MTIAVVPAPPGQAPRLPKTGRGSVSEGAMGYEHQLNSVDGRFYQSIMPQPSVWQLGLIKELG